MCIRDRPCNDQIIVSGLYLLVVYNFGLALYQITGINLIFQWAYERVALNRIVRNLNEMGIPAPSHYKKTTGEITSPGLIGSGKDVYKRQSQIATLVGYSKPSNFAAAFKKKYGVIPKNYKDENTIG